VLPFSEGLFLDIPMLTSTDQIMIHFYNLNTQTLLGFEIIIIIIGILQVLCPENTLKSEEVEISEEFSVPFDL
jgi:hypothetical protein